MKHVYLTLACATLSLALSAQTVLRHQTHGLVANHTNEMKITDYTEPGPSGKNVVWDFRNLELTKDFVGTLDNPTHSKGENIYSKSNTRLEEFGNSFFFLTTKKSIEQHGYMTASGNTYIVYDKPFVKMKYPFSYSNSFSGNFSGTYNTTQKQLGTIEGTYNIEADGIGTLMLPGNMVYEKALRVKEIKSFDQTINTRSYNIETTTYRWYVNEHRFPILVLIESITTYQDGRNFTSTQAAYNPIAIKEGAKPLDIDRFSEATLETYPNPYHDFVNIKFRITEESKVNLSIYDITGKLVKVIYTGTENAGEKSFRFSAKEISLSDGAYIVKLNTNGKEISRRIIEIK